ncbi:MAG: hypothetical protein HOP33_14385 [Verrucomicrobia bacterium]|nr:hypothetical protein [Verrucomicrobiota bacterium]
MNVISELGNQILEIVSNWGLPNGSHFQQGLNEQQLATHSRFYSHFHATELEHLFSWRNGFDRNSAASMANLWLVPDWLLLSLEDVELERDYYAKHIHDWREEWYPLLSNGTADRLFIDQSRITKFQVSVSYAFWESPQPIGQIYDNIEAMLRTYLVCYQRRAFYVDSDGCLNRHFRQEVAISRELNPKSDYWRREDLCS